MKYSEKDKLDCLIQMAYLQCGAKDAALFDETDGSEVTVPKRLDRRIKRLINRKARAATVTKVKRVMWRVAIAAMLAMSIMFILLVSVSGIREAIWRAIVEWHENYITIRYEDPDKENSTQPAGDSTESETKGNTDKEESSESTPDGSLENEKPSTTPTYIEEVRKPTYLPGGVVEDMLKTNTGVIIDYAFENELLFSFSQYIIKENYKYFDNETATVQQVNVNQYLASIVTYENNPEITIVWNDGEYVYVLVSAAIDVDEMITIAESVKAR